MLQNKIKQITANTGSNSGQYKRLTIAATISLVLAGCGGGSPNLTDEAALAALNAEENNELDISSSASTDNVDPTEVNQVSLFSSPTSSGFNAEILDDGSVELNWIPLADAVSYEVYRDDQLILTTNEPRIIVTESIAGTQSFEIQAIDEQNRSEVIADGLELEISEAFICSY